VQFWTTVPEVPVSVKTQQTPNLPTRARGQFFKNNSRQEFAPRCQPGLPDGFFSDQISKFGYILENIGMENVVIFSGHLEYLRPLGIIYCHLENSVVILYIFPFWFVLQRKIWQPCPSVEEVEKTSYPAAQLPRPVPPLLVHSLDVKQVPFRLELGSKFSAIFDNFRRKNGIFLKSQCYDQNFAYLSFVLSQKRQFFH
jgi:hypothetical protein